MTTKSHNQLCAVCGDELEATTIIHEVKRGTHIVSDHRGSNSQHIDFEGVEIYPIFMAKIENTEKSST
jgi:hypothetical protein